MVKTYLVSGASWVAEVDLEDVEHLTTDEIKMEAATRAVEAHLGKRHDIPINRHSPIKLTEEQKRSDELHTALIKLLTEELVTGCGIGMLLCIMDNADPDDYKKGEDHEWFLNSKKVLENVGSPELVRSFNEKYPNKKKEIG